MYIEAHRVPLNIRISKLQLKFWMNIQTYLNDNPDHPLKGLIDHGLEINLPYLKYYSNLESTYSTPDICERMLTNDFRIANAEKIRSKSNNDVDSRLGVYLLVNPQLAPPNQRVDILESERVLVSRYRCGSHNLKIESGRLCNPKIAREERLCICNTGVQSLRHCLFDCPLLHELHEEYAYTSIEEVFMLPDIVKLLMRMKNLLKVT